MGTLYYVAIHILILLSVTALGVGCSYSVFENEFINLPDHGYGVPINGQISIDQKGGHVQGIQMVQKGEKKVVFLSGSSNEVAFMVQVEIDSMATITSVDTLMLNPYRHAGGFQICGHYLIVVANWDSRYLDFYICPEDQMGVNDEGFRLVGNLNMETSSRKNWIDSKWRSYQNINLFAHSGDRFYLVGFASTEAGENIADLYSIKFRKEWLKYPKQIHNRDGILSLTKVESRKFTTIANTRFRWGAGLFRNNDGGLILLASPEHINRYSNVEWYSK